MDSVLPVGRTMRLRSARQVARPEEPYRLKGDSVLPVVNNLPQL